MAAFDATMQPSIVSMPCARAAWNAAIAAGVHLAPLCDYADLDGALLLADDADLFEGPPVPDLDPTDVVGTGARRR